MTRRPTSRCFAFFAVTSLHFFVPAHAEVDGTAIETTVQTCLASATTPEEARNCTFQGIDICASTQAGDAANPNQAREWCIRAGLQTWGEILDNEFRDAVNFAIDLDRPDNPLPDALRSAQASWVDFRTAHCRATFLFYELPSLQFVEEAACNLQMTADRAITLRAFRDGFTR